MTTTSRPTKEFRPYEDQVELLVERGMIVHDRAWAADQLRTINYYRLSGYWYPFRMLRPDTDRRSDRFLPGTDLREVIALHDFDARLRASTFSALSHIELTIRARLGHELGRIHPHIHLRTDLLGATARRPRSSTPSETYTNWRTQYDAELARSREDFVEHHRRKYGGQLPVWAAVEILDWGKLTRLYGMSPSQARGAVAADVELSEPQLESWLKALNILRNYAAHHGRVFNRVFTLKPRLPRADTHPEIVNLSPVMNRSFGQLSMVQYLLKAFEVGNPNILPSVFNSYPDVPNVPIGQTGAPPGWESTPFWRRI